jgi:P27 family predicted phage terminase small subunit
MKNSTKSKPKPPESLSKEAKTWWQQLVDQFEIDDAAGLMLLQQAMHAFDETVVAKAAIEKDGAVIEDRWGQKKQHPAVLNLRDARNLMLRSLKALNLDVQPGAPLGAK